MAKPTEKPAPKRARPAPAKSAAAKSSAEKSARQRVADRRPKPAPAKRPSKTEARPARPKPAAPRPERKTPAEPRRPEPSAWSGMSLDRRLDLLGFVFSLGGLLLLFILLSARRSAGSDTFVQWLGRMLGWGLYLFPLALIGLGLWLVLRRFERVTYPSGERLLGFAMLFTGLLTGLHWLLQPADQAAALQLAEAGQGGGYLGGTVAAALNSLLGVGGAGLAILAWLLIALAFALDVSVIDLFAWLGPAWERWQDALDDWRARRAEAAPAAYPPPPPWDESEAPPNFSAGESRPALAPPAGAQPVPAAPLSAPPHAWTLPQAAALLDPGEDAAYDKDDDVRRGQLIEETLRSFGAPAHIVEVNRGPTITQFGVEPDFIDSRGGRMRVRVGKIAALADDLALALSARTIRIQAPVPGRSYVGIEVPNETFSSVALREVVESEAFRRLKSPLRFSLGEDVAGNAVAADLAAMPHLLIAGQTGSGKSVCVNALITCLLLNNTPDDLRLIMVDPKRVELTGYNGIPHLLAPVVVEMERVVAVLQWVAREMDARYHKLAQAGSRNIADYNARQSAANQPRLPYLVVIVDELADLMMLAPDETERTLTRLAQLARATGIHLVIATQRPSVDVVTGLIKANFPARIAFAVASGVDSRVILDQPGAERLLGRGDMLFQAPDAAAPARLQGVFVSDLEIQGLVAHWQMQAGTFAPANTASSGPGPGGPPPGIPLKQIPLWEEAEQSGDPLLAEAIDLARRQGRASISMLQRRFRIGYTRAARLVEAMEEKGIVGPPNPGTGTREILDYGPAAPPVDEN